VNNPEDLWRRTELMVKVKEIQEVEYDRIQENQIIFAFFHLAEDSEPDMVRALQKTKATTIALEQLVVDGNVRIAIVSMSEIAAWNAAIQMAKLLFEPEGSLGIALANFSGASSPRITILGGGTVGRFAAKTLLGIGAEVTILEKSIQKIVELNRIFDGRARVLLSNDENLRSSMKESVGFINAIYPLPNSKTIVSRDHIRLLPKGGVVVDVSGSNIVETAHYTTIEHPIYVEEERIHYCVDNSPAQFAKTASKLLINSFIPYVIEIAEKGIDLSLKENKVLKDALNFYKGRLVNNEVALKQGLPVELMQ